MKAKLAVIFITALFCIQPLMNANAVILQFTLGNHPNGNEGLDPNALDAKDYGLRLDNSEGDPETFRFINVLMQVDTSNGNAHITGSMQHIQSNDFWNIDATLAAIGAHGSFDTQPVPYQNMFNDLKNLGAIDDADESIVYDNNFMRITPVGAVTAGTGYFGAREWAGKFNEDNDQLAIIYRLRLDPDDFDSPQWDLLAANGWFMPTNGTMLTGNQDLLFVMRNGTEVNAVPEPGTFALLGTGLVGLMRKRFKKA